MTDTEQRIIDAVHAAEDGIGARAIVEASGVCFKWTMLLATQLRKTGAIAVVCYGKTALWCRPDRVEHIRLVFRNLWRERERARRERRYEYIDKLPSMPVRQTWVDARMVLPPDIMGPRHVWELARFV